MSRFLEVDPVQGGSANDYDYVEGDPINAYDLSGQCNAVATWCVIGILRGTETLPAGFQGWANHRQRGGRYVIRRGRTSAGLRR